MRDERHSKNARSVLAHFFSRPRELDAAALAATTGMDLRLDDPDFATELARRVFRLGHGKARNASRRRHTVLAQDFLALILVNVH